MRIPTRIHCEHPLPGDTAWAITERRGPLTVYLAHDVPPDSPLEQVYVRQAVRAWRHRHYPGPLIALPIAGAGITWAVRKLQQPAVAAGTAVVAAAGVTLAAVTLTEPPQHPAPHRPPAAEAPPSQPSTPKPSTAPRKPEKPTAPKPAPPRPRPTVGVTAGSVRIDPPRLPVHPPVDVPPVRVTPPQTPAPPAEKTDTCRLVKVQVGKLVRICL